MPKTTRTQRPTGIETTIEDAEREWISLGRRLRAVKPGAFRRLVDAFRAPSEIN